MDVCALPVTATLVNIQSFSLSVFFCPPSSLLRAQTKNSHNFFFLSPPLLSLSPSHLLSLTVILNNCSGSGLWWKVEFFFRVGSRTCPCAYVGYMYVNPYKRVVTMHLETY